MASRRRQMSIRRYTTSPQTSCGLNCWDFRYSRVRATILILRCGTWVPLAQDSTAELGTSLMSGYRSRTPTWASVRGPPSSLGGTMDSKRLPKGNTLPWLTISSQGYPTAEACSFQTAKRTHSHYSLPLLHRATDATTAAASLTASLQYFLSTCQRVNS